MLVKLHGVFYELRLWLCMLVSVPVNFSLTSSNLWRIRWMALRWQPTQASSLANVTLRHRSRKVGKCWHTSWTRVRYSNQETLLYWYTFVNYVPKNGIIWSFGFSYSLVDLFSHFIFKKENTHIRLIMCPPHLVSSTFFWIFAPRSVGVGVVWHCVSMWVIHSLSLVPGKKTRTKEGNLSSIFHRLILLLVVSFSYFFPSMLEQSICLIPAEVLIKKEANCKTYIEYEVHKRTNEHLLCM